MFIMHISLVMAYMGMAVGAALVVWSLKSGGEGISLGKNVGYLVLVLSLFSLLCIGYYGIKYWSQGSFETTMEASMQKHHEMMQGMMGQGGMMGQMGQGGMMDQMDKDQMGQGKMDMPKPEVNKPVEPKK